MIKSTLFKLKILTQTTDFTLTISLDNDRSKGEIGHDSSTLIMYFSGLNFLNQPQTHKRIWVLFGLGYADGFFGPLSI